MDRSRRTIPAITVPSFEAFRVCSSFPIHEIDHLQEVFNSSRYTFDFTVGKKGYTCGRITTTAEFNSYADLFDFYAHTGGLEHAKVYAPFKRVKYLGHLVHIPGNWRELFQVYSFPCLHGIDGLPHQLLLLKYGKYEDSVLARRILFLCSFILSVLLNSKITLPVSTEKTTSMNSFLR